MQKEPCCEQHRSLVCTYLIFVSIYQTTINLLEIVYSVNVLCVKKKYETLQKTLQKNCKTSIYFDTSLC